MVVMRSGKHGTSPTESGEFGLRYLLSVLHEVIPTHGRYFASFVKVFGICRYP